MANQEDAICFLFVREIRSQAEEIGKKLGKEDVRYLLEPLYLNAFVNEWTIARLAWIDHLSSSVANAPLHLALKRTILQSVHTYEGLGKIKFVDYKFLIFSEAGASQPPTPSSLFLSGFRERMERIPNKASLPSKKKLTPHEEVEIMMAVIHSCWVAGFDLPSTLEALRPKATPEIVALL